MNSKHFVIIAALLIVALLWLVNRADAKLVEDAQSGVIVIKCHMKDGMRAIKPNDIKDHAEGYWVFSDGGYARSCIVIKNGNKL